MNKIFCRITSVILLFVLAFESHASASAAPLATQPGSGNAVVYEPPDVNGALLTYAQVEAQFGLVIYAYKQMRSYPGRSGTELIYFDINKINGPVGLTVSGSVCSSTQKADTGYYSDTVTVGYTFCAILDAIKAGTPLYGIVPTEGVFLHGSNGARLSRTGSGGAIYLINPADSFIRHYTVQRYLEKITELGIEGGFSDNLQPGWSKVTAMGTPVEYSSWTNYNNAMAGFACEIYSALKAVGREAWGNLTSVDPSIWAQYSGCLDGAMSETWIMDWGGFPSVSAMETDLTITQSWINSGRKVLLIAQDSTPDAASNQFVYASSLLVGNDVSHTFYKYANYSGAYSEYYAPPMVNIGNPKGPMYKVTTNIWERSFDAGCVRVDLSTKIGQITGTPCTAAPTQAAPTQMATVTSTSVVSSPTPAATFTSRPSSTATSIVMPTFTAVQPTFTSTVVPASPVPTQALPTYTATAIPASLTAQAPVVTPTAVIVSPGETTYDDRSPDIVYSSGWQDVLKRQAYKRSYKLTNQNGASMTLPFIGQSFTILYTGRNDFGGLDIYVDDVLVGTLREQMKRATFQQKWDSGQFWFGVHTLRLVFVTTDISGSTSGSFDAVIVR